jgi:hypothetical protein
LLDASLVLRMVLDLSQTVLDPEVGMETRLNRLPKRLLKPTPTMRRLSFTT